MTVSLDRDLPLIFSCRMFNQAAKLDNIYKSLSNEL